MTRQYDWPLGQSSMTFLDELKIGKFLLTNDKWTVGPEIEKYEKKWSEYTGCKYVVMVHSGSAANELIALRRRDQLVRQGKWIPGQNKVLFNVVNWISSISPFSNLSFKPVFVDVELSNLNPSVAQIEEKLKSDREIKTVFYTTLLGQSCDLEKLIILCEAYEVELLLDNCESSFSWEIFNKDDPFCHQKVHFCNLTLSSTSVYASHYTSGLQEGGLIFCQDEETYDWMRMMRNHGMTRGMPEKYRNSLVDPSFDFNVMGSNYRTTNLIAYMHSLDFDRSLKWSEGYRRNIAGQFYATLCFGDLKPCVKFLYPMFNNSDTDKHIPLALPIIKHPNCQDSELIGRVKGYLSAVGVGYRGLVGSNLLYHTAFQGLGNPKDYPNADYLHHNSIYIGLHAGVDSKMAVSLAKELSKL